MQHRDALFAPLGWKSMLEHTTDPGDPGNMPLAPKGRPRWRRRAMGARAIALVILFGGLAAWHYEVAAPPREDAPMVLPR